MFAQSRLEADVLKVSFFFLFIMIGQFLALKEAAYEIFFIISLTAVCMHGCSDHLGYRSNYESCNYAYFLLILCILPLFPPSVTFLSMAVARCLLHLNIPFAQGSLFELFAFYDYTLASK